MPSPMERPAGGGEAPPGYTPLAPPAASLRSRQLAAAAALAAVLLVVAALTVPRALLGGQPGAVEAPSRLYREGHRGEERLRHIANRTSHESDTDNSSSNESDKDNSSSNESDKDNSSSNESVMGNSSRHAEKDEEGKSEEEEPVKGTPFKLKLVNGTSAGCCSWHGRCDDSQGYCNSRKSNCHSCGGTWKEAFLPSNFAASPGAWCAKGKMDNWKVPAAPVYIRAADQPVEIKVLTYNLQWWKVYKKKFGMGGSEGHLIKNTGPYDIIGMQECQDPWRVLYDGGMDGEYFAVDGAHTDSTAVCAAFRKAAWELLAHGLEYVAEDGAGKYNYFGKRVAVWFRLRHRQTGETLLFLTHHGPLPLSSGGMCGGHATGYNLLDLVARKARQGDAVVLVGDFNAKADSMTVRTLESQLARVYSGWRFGGIDHVFTNLGHARLVDQRNLGEGGSDHDALSVTMRLGLQREKVMT